MNRFPILLLAFAVLAVSGCGGRTEVAPSAQFVAQEVERIAVVVDEVKDLSGARSPTIEADIANVFDQALMSKKYEIATAKIDQRDALGRGFTDNSTPISDAAALRYAGSAGASHVLVITMTRDPRPRTEHDPRGPCSISARMLDAKMRSAVWSASHAEPSWVVTPMDAREAIHDVAAAVAAAIPTR